MGEEMTKAERRELVAVKLAELVRLMKGMPFEDCLDASRAFDHALRRGSALVDTPAVEIPWRVEDDAATGDS